MRTKHLSLPFLTSKLPHVQRINRIPVRVLKHSTHATFPHAGPVTGAAMVRFGSHALVPIRKWLKTDTHAGIEPIAFGKGGQQTSQLPQAIHHDENMNCTGIEPTRPLAIQFFSG